MREADLDVFDTTIQKTASWLNELMRLLGWQDRHKAYLALRATLHALRDYLTYKQAFEHPSPDAYETLLLDVLRGDCTLFMRSDQVEAAWAVVMPILEAWAATPPDFPNYPAGTWGPEAAEMLLARDARRWLLPSFSDAARATPRSLPLDGQPEQ